MSVATEGSDVGGITVLPRMIAYKLHISIKIIIHTRFLFEELTGGPLFTSSFMLCSLRDTGTF